MKTKILTQAATLCALILIFAALSACGGGSGSSDETDPANNQAVWDQSNWGQSHWQ